MSWSVSGIGKSDKLAAKLAEQIHGYSLAEPEQTVARTASTLIGTALLANVPASVVRVHAFGSQSRSGQKDGPDRITNTIEIKIEQLGDFVE